VGRAERVTELIKSHDSKLYCERSESGKLCIYRKSSRVEWYELDGSMLGFVRPTSHLIMALTHNWFESGYEVDWGLEVIFQRLKSLDLWTRDLAADIEKNEERIAKERLRDTQNKNEDFLREFRKPFAKAFSDVNTANMKKIDKRRIEEKKVCQS
jgi:hypothetical protein